MEIIEQHQTLFYVLALAFGLYMCWGIGANDVANAMGTSVGSGAITVRQALDPGGDHGVLPAPIWPAERWPTRFRRASSTAGSSNRCRICWCSA
jgi:hypothetical protein